MKAVKFQASSWVERNYPSTLEDLFAHKKKVEEVQSWLKEALGLSGQTHRRVCSISSFWRQKLKFTKE